MVKGMKSFVEQFREFPDCYTVIGGAACDVLLTEAGLDFRATKDIDMQPLSHMAGTDIIYNKKFVDRSRCLIVCGQSPLRRCGKRGNP